MIAILIIAVLLGIHAQWKLHKLNGKYEIMKGLHDGLYSHINTIETMNTALWSMVNERKGNKREAGQAKQGSVRVINPTGKGSKGKGNKR